MRDIYTAVGNIVNFVDTTGRDMQGVQRFTSTQHLFPEGFTDRNDGHTYRASLLATSLHGRCPQLGNYINLGETVSIINLHDTPEVITTDIPLDYHRGENNRTKHHAEIVAMEQLTESLHPDDADSFRQLHRRFTEASKSSCRDTAALFARLCDAMEGNVTALHRNLEKVDQEVTAVAVKVRVGGVAQTLAQTIWETDTPREERVAAIHELQVIISHHISLYTDRGLFL